MSVQREIQAFPVVAMPPAADSFRHRLGCFSVGLPSLTVRVSGLGGLRKMSSGGTGKLASLPQSGPRGPANLTVVASAPGGKTLMADGDAAVVTLIELAVTVRNSAGASAASAPIRDLLS